MRRLIVALAAALGLAMAMPAHAVAAPAHDSAGTGTRVMVMLDLPPGHFRSNGSYGGTYGDDVGRQIRLHLARRIAAAHRLTVVEDWPMDVIGVDCVIMQVNDTRSAADVVHELDGVRGVSWSQPLNEYNMQGADSVHYNDSLLPAQPGNMRWHLASLHRFTTGKGITIGIVDSRIDTGHPDLVGQIAASSDFVTNGDRPERHGTGVAGIIAARPNNSVGIVGVAPGARVLGLRACWERPVGGATVCNSLSLAKAIVFALEHNVDVLNLSLAGPPDPLLTKLIGVAVSRGISVVVAVDPNMVATSFPASLPGVVPVGSEALSTRGGKVYIAPGIDVPTTEPEGKWSLVSGSSFAAAHVTALIALLEQAAGRRVSADRLLGPRGNLDACVLVARQSRMDAASCEVAR